MTSIKSIRLDFVLEIKRQSIPNWQQRVYNKIKQKTNQKKKKKISKSRTGLENKRYARNYIPIPLHVIGGRITKILERNRWDDKRQEREAILIPRLWNQPLHSCSMRVRGGGKK